MRRSGGVTPPIPNHSAGCRWMVSFTPAEGAAWLAEPSSHSGPFGVERSRLSLPGRTKISRWSIPQFCHHADRTIVAAKSTGVYQLVPLSCFADCNFVHPSQSLLSWGELRGCHFAVLVSYCVFWNCKVISYLKHENGPGLQYTLRGQCRPTKQGKPSNWRMKRKKDWARKSS
jgi:hypothetical protein